MLNALGPPQFSTGVRHNVYETKASSLGALLPRRVADCGFYQVERVELDLGEARLDVGLFPVRLPERLGPSIPERLLARHRTALHCGLPGGSDGVRYGLEIPSPCVVWARGSFECAGADLDRKSVV